jgi:hypothetical protein
MDIRVSFAYCKRPRNSSFSYSRPLKYPDAEALWKRTKSLSTVMLKRKGERRSPYFNPFWTLNSWLGEPLMRMARWELEMQSWMIFLHFLSNPMLSMTWSKYSHRTKSKALWKSNFRIKPFRPLMEFLALLELATRWKNLVFLSPSLHQFCLDFCLQIASTFLITTHGLLFKLLKRNCSVADKSPLSPFASKT